VRLEKLAEMGYIIYRTLGLPKLISPKNF